LSADAEWLYFTDVPPTEGVAREAKVRLPSQDWVDAARSERLPSHFARSAEEVEQIVWPRGAVPLALDALDDATPEQVATVLAVLGLPPKNRPRSLRDADKVGERALGVERGQPTLSLRLPLDGTRGISAFTEREVATIEVTDRRLAENKSIPFLGGKRRFGLTIHFTGKAEIDLDGCSKEEAEKKALMTWFNLTIVHEEPG
jgi:hypothetical protein